MTDTLQSLDLIYGLDLNSPRARAMPGSLRASKGYEIDATGGYSLMKGGGWMTLSGQTEARYFETFDVYYYAFCELTGIPSGTTVLSDSGTTINILKEDPALAKEFFFSGYTEDNVYAWVAIEGLGFQFLDTNDTFTLTNPAQTLTPVSWRAQDIQGFWRIAEVRSIERGLLPAVVAYFLAGLVAESFDRPTPDTPLQEANRSFVSGIFFNDYDAYYMAPNEVAPDGNSPHYPRALPGTSGANSADGMHSAKQTAEIAFDEGILRPISNRLLSTILENVGSLDGFQNFINETSTEGDDFYIPGNVIYKEVGGTAYWATISDVYQAPGTEFVGENISNIRAASIENVADIGAEISNTQVLDGVTLATGDFVLLKDQDDLSENGLYQVNGDGLTVTRFLLVDDQSFRGDSVFPVRILEGDDNVDRVFKFLAPVDRSTLELEVDGLNFIEFFPAQGVITVCDIFSETGGVVTEITDQSLLPVDSVPWEEGRVVYFTDGNGFLDSIQPGEFIGSMDSGFGSTAQSVLLRTVQLGGNFFSGTAVGYIVTGPIQGVVGNPPEWIRGDLLRDVSDNEAGTIIRGSDNDDVRDVLTTTTTNLAVTLPSFDDIVDAGTRYQYVEHNFLALDADNQPNSNPLSATYLVNGVGTALEFTRTTGITRIRTGLPFDKDKPTYVSVHANSLILAYPDGTINLSVPGQPKNFSGVQGAATFGVGRTVTGLVKLNGASTAIFTDDSIYILQGTSTLDYVLRPFSENTGCFPYTAVNMGEVLYCNRHGISTLQASDVYGDFRSILVSDRVRPYMDVRLDRNTSSLESEAGGGGSSRIFSPTAPLLAYAFPSKNQYRLVFNDGSVLITTLQDYTSSGPKFMTDCLEKRPTENSDLLLNHIVVVQDQNRLGQDVVLQSISAGENNDNYGIRRLEFIAPLKRDTTAWIVIGPYYGENFVTEEQTDNFALLAEGSHLPLGVTISNDETVNVYPDSEEYDQEGQFGSLVAPFGPGFYVDPRVHIAHRSDSGKYLLIGLSADQNEYDVYLPHRLQQVISVDQNRRFTRT